MYKIALIPSYEPQDNLINLIQELDMYGFTNVVVDDGSGEDYADIFDSIKQFATVISYKGNRGKGHALKTGLEYIRLNYPDSIIITMDSDGQHTVRDADRLFDVVINNRLYGDLDVFAIGCRVLPDDAPFKSRYGNAITRFVYRSLTGVNIYDTQSGLRAFSSNRIDEMIAISGDRYEYEMNVLLYISKHKIPVVELPIEVIYFDKQNSISHFNAVKDSIKIYKEIFKYAGSSVASFVVDYLMYVILTRLFGAVGTGLIIANYGARAISSVFNFTLNKKYVFESKGKLLPELIKYYALAFANISINTLILTTLTGLGLNSYGAKIIVEVIMFVVCYIIQHYLIFNTSKELESRKEQLWTRILKNLKNKSVQ